VDLEISEELKEKMSMHRFDSIETMDYNYKIVRDSDAEEELTIIRMEHDPLEFLMKRHFKYFSKSTNDYNEDILFFDMAAEKLKTTIEKSNKYSIKTARVSQNNLKVVIVAAGYRTQEKMDQDQNWDTGEILISPDFKMHALNKNRTLKIRNLRIEYADVAFYSTNKFSYDREDRKPLEKFKKDNILVLLI